VSAYAYSGNIPVLAILHREPHRYDQHERACKGLHSAYDKGSSRDRVIDSAPNAADDHDNLGRDMPRPMPAPGHGVGLSGQSMTPPRGTYNNTVTGRRDRVIDAASQVIPARLTIVLDDMG